MEKEEAEGFIEGNIPLILNSYADIFSSFDSRPYSEKALSDDFLLECKKAARDKGDFGLELTLSIPKAKRNINDEAKIRKRLREHFHKHSLEKEKEIKSIKREGFVWALIGSFLMIIASLLETYNKTLLINFLLVITIPAGWFIFWEGMSRIFVQHRQIEPDRDFYKKMANATINFKSY